MLALRRAPISGFCATSAFRLQMDWISAKKQSATAGKKALELFGKATGFYVERMEIHDKGPLATLATAVLLKMQAELTARIKLEPPPVTISGVNPEASQLENDSQGGCRSG